MSQDLKDKVRYAKQEGIVDSVTLETSSYPEGFYHVLEDLDLVVRVWLGEKMGTSGVRELTSLISVFNTDPILFSHIPEKANALLKSICNPQSRFDICTKADLGHGDIIKAYACMRKYLIDNKERVAMAYNHYDNYHRNCFEEKKTNEGVTEIDWKDEYIQLSNKYDKLYDEGQEWYFLAKEYAGILYKIKKIYNKKGGTLGEFIEEFTSLLPMSTPFDDEFRKDDVN